MYMLLKRIPYAFMVLAATAVAFIAVAIGYGVIVRKMSLASPVWVNDVTSYALLLITFSGGAYVVAKDAHTRVDIFRDSLTENGRHLVSLFADAICFVSSSTLAVAACMVSLDNFERGTRLVRAIVLPKWVVIAIVAAGAAMVAATYAIRLLAGLRRRAGKSN